MRVFKLREKLHRRGLLLLEHGTGWMVTDHGVKTPFEQEFETLEAVETWMTDEFNTNRLTDKEADEFDDQWAKFVNQCDGCRRGLPLDDNGVHHGESLTDMMGCTRNRYKIKTECRTCGHVEHHESITDFAEERCDNCHSLSFGQKIVTRG
jgi:hypothetical protein